MVFARRVVVLVLGVLLSAFVPVVIYFEGGKLVMSIGEIIVVSM